MQEFGDFAKIDIEKLLKGFDEQLAHMEEFQQKIGSCVGRAEDENGLVVVEYDHQGVRELELHPKAMRLSSGELADLIKTVLRDATADFQNRYFEGAKEVFGEENNPMNVARDPEAALGKIKDAEAIYDRAFEDVMGELDRIRRRMNL
jgi:DNA-binding protein YbaB